METPTQFRKNLPPISKQNIQNIINYAIKMKQDGLEQETIKGRIRVLNQLARQAELTDTNAIRNFLLTKKWKQSTRGKNTDIYTYFLKFLKIDWKPPHIKPEETPYFIPTEKEIDLLIASCSKAVATLLQTFKETAIRPIETTKLKWEHLDTTQKTLAITPAKGSRARLLPISDKLLNMLNRLHQKRPTIFPKSLKGTRETFVKQRKTLAERLQNPRIRRITFYTFRHWKATMEYHKTKDIIHVKNFLGHKSINSTMVYINLESALFHTNSDEWTCKATNDKDKAIKLIEAGFEYVNEIDGYKLYRKRK